MRRGLVQPNNSHSKPRATCHFAPPQIVPQVLSQNKSSQDSNRPGSNRPSFNRPNSQFAPLRIVLHYKNKKFGFLRREQGHQELVVEQLSVGQARPRQRRGDELRTERMLEVIKRYEADVVNFLHDMAANLEINLRVNFRLDL